MGRRLRCLRCALTAAVMTATWAQESEPPSGEGWTGSAAASWYLLPDVDDFVLPVLIARRGGLHLEARYNYEARDTASIFGGWLLQTGAGFELEATPMLGAALGATDGIAAACTISIAWKQLALYSENEYLAVPADRSENYYYNWSELTYGPVDWLRAGMVTQRTRVFQTERDLQRGVLVGFARDRFSLTGYWFNPGSDDEFGVVSLGVEW